MSKDQEAGQNGMIIVSNGESEENSVSLGHVGLVDPSQEFGNGKQ